MNKSIILTVLVVLMCIAGVFSSTALSVNDFKISLADSKENLAGSKTYKEASAGKKFSLLTIPQNKWTRIYFRVGAGSEAFQPQQVGIRFSSNDYKYVAPAAYSVDAYSYVFSNKDIGRVLKYNSGNYQVDIILGDSNKTPLIFNAGEINLTFNQTSTTKSRFEELKAIEHQFRQPEKRPAAIVSQTFTLAVLAPIAIFVIGLLAVGINFGSLPGGMGFIYTVAFLGCIASITYLIIQFWISLTMVVTLRYLAVLLLPTVFFGQKSLTSFANDRLSN